MYAFPEPVYPSAQSGSAVCGPAGLEGPGLDPGLECVAQLHTALTIQENSAMAMILMTEVELKEGNTDQGLAYAKKLQEISPQNYIGYLLEGNIWMIRKDSNRARSAYTRAWNLHKTSEIAAKLYNSSKYISKLEEAIKPLLAWLNEHPDDTKIRFTLATVYQKAKMNDLAIQEYEKLETWLIKWAKVIWLEPRQHLMLQ